MDENQPGPAQQDPVAPVGERQGQDDLRWALHSLKNFLSQSRLGLIPSKLCPYITYVDDDPIRNAAAKYLAKCIQNVVKTEIKGELDVAVDVFVGNLLSDDIPPLTLDCFMETLVNSNKGGGQPCQEAWRVHDVLRLAARYCPLHKALLQGVEEGTLSLPHVFENLKDRRRLTENDCEQILDLLRQDASQAVAYLLALVYLDARIPERRRLKRYRETRDQVVPDWLSALLKCIEKSWTGERPAAAAAADAGDGTTTRDATVGAAPAVDGTTGCFRKSLPASMLTEAYWRSVNDELVATRFCSREELPGFIENSHGLDSSDSDVSDSPTLTGETVRNNLDCETPKISCTLDKPVINLILESPLNEVRLQRTARYVGQLITPTLEHIDHRPRIDTRRIPTQRNDTEGFETASVVTAATEVSQEDNTLVNSTVRLQLLQQQQQQLLLQQKLKQQQQPVRQHPQLQQHPQHQLQVQQGQQPRNPGLATTGSTAPRVDPVDRDLARTLRYSGLSDSAAASDEEQGRLQLYAFQDELLMETRQGRNCMVVLPTGTGKTFVAIKYMLECLENPNVTLPQRVVFLAPKVKLAEQQYRRLLNFFPNKTLLRTGRMTTCSGPLSEILEFYQVFVMTPMCLAQAIKKQEVRVTDFRLLVLDECHHALGRQDFSVLMGLYMDVKLSSTPAPELPQILALSASPGVGKGDSLQGAVQHIKQLCYNMDLERICTVEQHLQQLQQFVNVPKHVLHECGKRKKEGFRQIVEEIIQGIEDDMIQATYHQYDGPQQTRLRKILTPPDRLHRGAIRYTHWIRALPLRLASAAAHNLASHHTALVCQADMLQIYQRSLVLNEDCESRYAMEYLEQEVTNMEERLSGCPSTDYSVDVQSKLIQDFNRYKVRLQKATTDTEDFNPKLRTLEDILLAMKDKNEGGKCACMIFVRTIDLSRALVRWIEEHPDLKELKPGRITGIRRGGMSEQTASEVLEKFNRGDHQLVVCTSAAEEGIDVKACNVVIRYDYCTSMISTVQTRGRARMQDSLFCDVSSSRNLSARGRVSGGLQDLAFQHQAAERLMEEAIKTIKEEISASPGLFRREMESSQREDWSRRQQEHLQQRLLKRRREESEEEQRAVFELMCRKCPTLACLSTDVRLYDPSGSRSRLVVGAEDFDSKWRRSTQADRDLERVSPTLVRLPERVLCATCSQDWGVLMRHEPSGVNYPCIKLESFLLRHVPGTPSPAKWFAGPIVRWINAPFDCKEITSQELQSLTLSPGDV